MAQKLGYEMYLKRNGRVILFQHINQRMLERIT